MLNEAKAWKFHHYNAVKTNILAAQYNRKQSTEHKLKRGTSELSIQFTHSMTLITESLHLNVNYA